MNRILKIYRIIPLVFLFFRDVINNLRKDFQTLSEISGIILYASIEW